MKTVYLKDGEAVRLHKELENNEYVIERMYKYEGYEGEIFCEPSGVKEVVNEVFAKPPIGKKHDDLIKIIEKTEAKNKELSEVENQIRLAKSELRESEKFKTDLLNHVINKNELRKAKSITVFSEFKAFTLTEDEEKRSLSLSYRIDVWEGKMDAWVYTLDYEGRRGYSRHVNPKYGLLVDATPEEILKIGKEIVKNSKEIKEYDLMNVIPEEYLTEELKVRKAEITKSRKKAELEKLEKEIKDKQTKLKELKYK